MPCIYLTMHVSHVKHHLYQQNIGLIFCIPYSLFNSFQIQQLSADFFISNITFISGVGYIERELYQQTTTCFRDFYTILTIFYTRKELKMWIEGLCIVAVVVIYLTYWLNKWSNPKCNGVLPPGSMGLPIIGESFQLNVRSYSLDVHPFIKKRAQR